METLWQVRGLALAIVQQQDCKATLTKTSSTQPFPAQPSPPQRWHLRYAAAPYLPIFFLPANTYNISLVTPSPRRINCGSQANSIERFWTSLSHKVNFIPKPLWGCLVWRVAQAFPKLPQRHPVEFSRVLSLHPWRRGAHPGLRTTTHPPPATNPRRLRSPRNPLGERWEAKPTAEKAAEPKAWSPGTLTPAEAALRRAAHPHEGRRATHPAAVHPALSCSGWAAPHSGSSGQEGEKVTAAAHTHLTSAERRGEPCTRPRPAFFPPSRRGACREL